MICKTLLLLLGIAVVIMLIFVGVMTYKESFTSDFSNYYHRLPVPEFDMCTQAKLDNLYVFNGYDGAKCVDSDQCQPGLKCIWSLRDCSDLVPTSGTCRRS